MNKKKVNFLESKRENAAKSFQIKNSEKKTFSHQKTI